MPVHVESSNFQIDGVEIYDTPRESSLTANVHSVCKLAVETVYTSTQLGLLLHVSELAKTTQRVNTETGIFLTSVETQKSLVRETQAYSTINCADRIKL